MKHLTLSILISLALLGCSDNRGGGSEPVNGPPSVQPAPGPTAVDSMSPLARVPDKVRAQFLKDRPDAKVSKVKARQNPDGTVRNASIVDRGRMSDPLIRAAAESARRTFFNPQCTPLKLPSDKYEVWKDLDVTFDPRDLL